MRRSVVIPACQQMASIASRMVSGHDSAVEAQVVTAAHAGIAPPPMHVSAPIVIPLDPLTLAARLATPEALRTGGTFRRISYGPLP